MGNRHKKRRDWCIAHAFYNNYAQETKSGEAMASPAAPLALPNLSYCFTDGQYSGPSIIRTPSDKILEMPTWISSL